MISACFRGNVPFTTAFPPGRRHFCIMGKQYNKVIKRRRRQTYLKRRAERIKANKALAKKKAPAKKKAAAKKKAPARKKAPAKAKAKKKAPRRKAA